MLFSSPSGSAAISPKVIHESINLNNLDEIVPVLDDHDSKFNEILQNTDKLKESSEVVNRIQKTYIAVVNYSESWTERLFNKLWSIIKSSNIYTTDDQKLLNQGYIYIYIYNISHNILYNIRTYINFSSFKLMNYCFIMENLRKL